MNVVQFFSKSKNALDLPQCPTDWRKHLSNFTSCTIIVHGFIYKSPEHAFQGLKTRLCSTATEEYSIKFEGNSMTPQQAKYAGGKGAYKKNNIVLDLEKWDAVRVDIMEEIIIARIKSDSLFQHILKQTKQKNMLLLHFERSGKNSFWGGSYKMGVIRGHNILGKIMMKLRE